MHYYLSKAPVKVFSGFYTYGSVFSQPLRQRNIRSFRNEVLIIMTPR